MIKVLYLYSGDRQSKFKGRVGVDYPDTQFYGLNHYDKKNIFAEYKEPIVVKIFRILFGFRVSHCLSYFFTFRYDIVFGPSLLYAMFFKKIWPTKTHFILFNLSLVRTIKANSKNKIKMRVIKWLLKEFDAIVCLSVDQKNFLETNGLLNDKVFFVPLGVDMHYYKPVYEGREKYILSAGRDNGRDYKTVVELARQMPSEEFHIVCSKRNMIGIINIPVNVSVFYDLPIKDLISKYKEAKLMLLITHSDNFLDGADCSGQTVLLESMASGLPVIATKKQYMRDYLAGDEILFIDNNNNLESIKMRIETLRNDDLRLKLSKKARLAIEANLSTFQMARKLPDIFNLVYTN